MVGVGQQCAKCDPVDLCSAARDLILETFDKQMVLDQRMALGSTQPLTEMSNISWG